MIVLGDVGERIGVKAAPVLLYRIPHRPRVRGEKHRAHVDDSVGERELRPHGRPVERAVRGGLGPECSPGWRANCARRQREAGSCEEFPPEHLCRQ